MAEILQLARLLSSLPGEEWDGSTIARVSWERRIFMEGDEKAAKLLPGRHAHAYLRQAECVLPCGGMTEILRVMMFLKGHLNKDRVDCSRDGDAYAPERLCAQGMWKISPLSREIWHWKEKGAKFSLEEILDFVQAAGDSNSIHKGRMPVVPGLLLLLRLLAAFPAERAELRFRHAIFAGEQVVLRCPSISGSRAIFDIYATDRSAMDGWNR